MRLLILLVITLVFNNCTAIKPENEIVKLDGPVWTLTAINHKPISGTNRTAFLVFDEDLEVKGKAFCNSVTAEYELMGKNQLTFNEITSTKMYCDGVMNLENEMITNLQKVRRYEIRNGMLYLHSSDALLLTFKK